MGSWLRSNPFSCRRPWSARPPPRPGRPRRAAPHEASTPTCLTPPSLIEEDADTERHHKRQRAPWAARAVTARTWRAGREGLPGDGLSAPEGKNAGKNRRIDSRHTDEASRASWLPGKCSRQFRIAHSVGPEGPPRGRSKLRAQAAGWVEGGVPRPPTAARRRSRASNQMKTGAWRGCLVGPKNAPGRVGARRNRRGRHTASSASSTTTTARGPGSSGSASAPSPSAAALAPSAPASPSGYHT